MSIRSNMMKWRNVSRCCAGRVADYSELLALALELEQTKKRLVRELSALVALALAAPFTLSFVCVAIVATTGQASYFLPVV